MKHVLVITPVRSVTGGEPISEELERVITEAVESIVENLHGPCYTQTKFNEDSATVAVCKLYGRPIPEDLK